MHEDGKLRSPNLLAGNKDTTPIAAKKNVWVFQTILKDPQGFRMPEEDFQHTKEVLYFDMVSEYDGRLYVAYLQSLPIVYSPEFGDVTKVWADDEDNHFRGFKILNETVFGLTDADMQEVYARKPNFEPMEHLFRDEFTLLALSAYDELCTVRGYTADMPLYRQFGPDFTRFMQLVIADEAWHFSKFLHLIKRYHQDRIGDIEAVMEEVRTAEALPYQNTFVLDHKEEVFTPDVLDSAARLLIKNVRG